MNRVTFGPWLGEFGWELCFWQGRLRRLANTTYKDYYKTVISYPGREILYEWADEFNILPSMVVDDVELGLVKQNMYFIEGDHADWITDSINKWTMENFEGEVVRYDPALFPSNHDHKLDQQDFVKLATGLPGPDRKQICLFPRLRKHQEFRNWSTENWNQLAQMLVKDGYRVIVLGSKESGNHMVSGDGVSNLVGRLTLKGQVHYIEHSEICITSFCGAIRLLTLCGCPAVSFGEQDFVQTTNNREGGNLLRTYFGSPLRIPTKQGSWDFSPEEIYAEVNKCL